MKNTPSIIIAGAGGIARALGLILAEWSPNPLRIWIGNRHPEKAEQAVKWIQEGSTLSVQADAFHLPEGENYPKEIWPIFEQSDVLLDCLPGKEAPRMARLAKRFGLHYANLTEHVRETEEIMELGKGSDKAFVLQCGLAPGYIDILAHGMFQDFCREYEVSKVDKIAMRVGALTHHAVDPAYYGFTWSPVGVATEYLEPAVVVRNYKKKNMPALSSRKILRINAIAYEEALTSGGAADLPDALSGKVRKLDYKTLRFPGHYEWVEQQLRAINADNNSERIRQLQERMEAAIPYIEEDMVVVYAAVQGKGRDGRLRRKEQTQRIMPQLVGEHMLKAIQTTTAAPIAEIALQLIQDRYKGVILQSMLAPDDFLEGKIIQRVFGNHEE